MFPRKYILGTLFACLATIVAVFGLALFIGDQDIQGAPLRIISYTLMAAFGIGWGSLAISLASLAAGPYLRTLSEEQMLKRNIPMMIFWREVFDHIPKRGYGHDE